MVDPTCPVYPVYPVDLVYTLVAVFSRECDRGHTSGERRRRPTSRSAGSTGRVDRCRRHVEALPQVYRTSWRHQL